eukprot:241321_1
MTLQGDSTLSRKPSVFEKHWKRFTYDQIEKKVAQRWNYPEYYDVLMESAVYDDGEGVYFDVKHAAWNNLISLIQRGPALSGPGPEQEEVSPDLGHVQRKSAPEPSATTLGDMVDSDGKEPPRGSEDSGKNPLKSEKSTGRQVKSEKRSDVEKHRKSHKHHRRRISKQKHEALESLSRELCSKSPNLAAVRAACVRCGVPSNFRARIWKILLGLGAHTKHRKRIESGKPLANQRVIRIDIERTRGTNATFKDQSVRHEMEVVLTEYCRLLCITYKQGMNYILAPFFLVELSGRDEIYAVYSAFIDRFLPNIFTDDEFGGLQCSFRMFRLLIQYHDPKLCNFLDQHDINPELYAAPWFMTFHGNRIPDELLLHFWDQILLADDPRAIIFISLSLLLENSSKIFEKNFVELPEYISRLGIISREHILRLVKKARYYSANTPSSFHNLLQEVTTVDIPVDSDRFQLLEDMLCMHVDSTEVVLQLYQEGSVGSNPHSAPATPTPDDDTPSESRPKRSHSALGDSRGPSPPKGTPSLGTRISPARSRTNSLGDGRLGRSHLRSSGGFSGVCAPKAQVKLFILDCRSAVQYDAGHLPCAFHLDPNLYLQPGKLAQRVDSLVAMAHEGCHFCFLGEGRGRETALLSLCLFFLQKGFRRVSLCEGGYRECHEIIADRYEMIDHNPAACVECQHNSATTASGWISSVRGKLTGMISETAEKRRTRSEMKRLTQTPITCLALPSSYEMLL